MMSKLGYRQSYKVFQGSSHDLPGILLILDVLSRFILLICPYLEIFNVVTL